MEVGFKSDKGRRRFNNEDACFVLKHDKVYVVADGVGGNKSGEIASRTAVNEVANYILENPVDEIETEEALKDYFEDCIKKANSTVLEMSERHEENKGMATTIVVAYARKGKAYIVNVGDSRAYVYRDKILHQVTEDHTYVNTLLKAGIISEEEALTHENKNMITRAVGADYEVDPDFFHVDIKAGDIILICTDGLYGELEPEEITGVLDEGQNMSETCHKLVSFANKNGGHDNITIICLKVTEEDIDE